MNIKTSFLFASILITAACTSNVDKAAETITMESLLEPIEILSSDEFEGRAPATRGEELTIQYLVEQYEKIGLAPGMPDGTYIQRFPLLGMNVDRETASLKIRKNGRVAEDLDYFTEFMAWPSNEEERVEIRNAELVYVGYGIQAPEYDWDDYKGKDVSGKILVFKNDDPKYDPDIFGGRARLYYGRWSYKYEIAEKMGALGAIIIHTTPTAGYPWLVVSNSWGRERFSLKSVDDNIGKPEFNGWFTQESSRKLFDLAGLSLREQLEAADDREFNPVTLTGISLDMDLKAEYSDMFSRNVVGRIEGNDPELREQYLVFTAHHDHLGITMPVEGDSINNGALDNAAGISAMLNLANAY
ncbi:MAG: M28 family peptidase, partial [Balneolaceae bacterium]